MLVHRILNSLDCFDLLRLIPVRLSPSHYLELHVIFFFQPLGFFAFKVVPEVASVLDTEQRLVVLHIDAHDLG